jgi:hypothetical protein
MAFSRHTANPFLSMKRKLSGKRQISPNHTRKLSEVLLDFAEQIIPLNDDPKVVSNVVSMAIVLWNTPLMPPALQAESMDRFNRMLAAAGLPDAAAAAARWLELRQTNYRTDRRMVMDYNLEHTAQGPELSVSSLDLDRPENRSFMA